MVRRRIVEQHTWLQASISSHSFTYDFGIAPPSELDRLHEITRLDLFGAVHWPEEWRGAGIEAYLSADRKVETVLRLGRPPPGQPYTDRHFDSEVSDIGYIHRVPKASKPKHLVFEVALPHDMLLQTAQLIRSGSWKAIAIYFAPKPPPADPKARWIRTIGFQAEVDPS